MQTDQMCDDENLCLAARNCVEILERGTDEPSKIRTAGNGLDGKILDAQFRGKLRQLTKKRPKLPFSNMPYSFPSPKLKGCSSKVGPGRNPEQYFPRHSPAEVWYLCFEISWKTPLDHDEPRSGTDLSSLAPSVVVKEIPYFHENVGTSQKTVFVPHHAFAVMATNHYFFYMKISARLQAIIFRATTSILRVS